MMKFVRFIALGFLLFVAALPTHKASAQFGACLPAFCASTPITGCTEGNAFIARTSGLDALHINAYQDFICGLVADGIFSKFDIIYIFATQDSTTAGLNLVSTSYPAIVHGVPAFVADRGYTGVSGSATIYIDTGFNPTIAASPKYVLNSAHISGWSLTNVQSGDALLGAFDAGPSNHTYILPWFTGTGLTYFRVNLASSTSDVGPPTGDSRGHFLATRSAVNTELGYINGVNAPVSGTVTSGLTNNNLYVLGTNNNGTPSGAAFQETMASVGSDLNATNELNFYNRLRTYMTTVGVP